MKLLLDTIAPIDASRHCGKPKWSVWNDITAIDDKRIVVFNTLRRTAILMDACEYAAEIASMPPKTVEMLTGLGMIVDAGFDERAEVERRFDDGKRDMSYIDLTVLLTHDCQLGCTYCFEGAKSRKYIDDGTAHEILRFLESMKPVCRRLRVTWFGGEPLMAYAQLKRLSMALISFCNDNGIDYRADMTTNGYALSPSRCKELVDELAVRRYIITIDGPAAMHNRRRPLTGGQPTFARIMENVAQLASCGAQVTLRMTIDHENAPDIPQLLDEIAEAPFKKQVRLSFCRTIDYNFTPDAAKATIFSRKEWVDVEWVLMQYAHRLGLWQYGFPYAAPSGGCLRQGDIVVDADGQIYKCLDTVGDRRWLCGHINSPDTPEWMALWNAWSPANSMKCRHCTLQPLCNGGCPHNALFDEKKHGSEYQCPYWKDNYKRQIIALVSEIDENNQ